jgi:putative lipoprotein
MREGLVTLPIKRARAPRARSRWLALRWLLSTLIAVRLFVAARAARADDDPWFGRDKALHFTLSAAIAGGGYAIAVPLTDDRRWRVAAGAGLAIAAGAGKEISDRYDGGDASWRDFTWDLIGTATGVGVAWLIDHWVSGHGVSGRHPHATEQPAGP